MPDGTAGVVHAESDESAFDTEVEVGDEECAGLAVVEPCVGDGRYGAGGDDPVERATGRVSEGAVAGRESRHVAGLGEALPRGLDKSGVDIDGVHRSPPSRRLSRAAL